MGYDKSILLEQINIAIKKNWYQKNGNNTNLPVDGKSTNKNNCLTVKNYFISSENTASIERLEQRIMCLEDQNDQLLQYINLMVEKLPDLILHIIHSDRETQDEFDHHDSLLQPKEDLTNSNCCQVGNDPCPTRRERDILELLVKGLCAKEIAHKLFISETTVITHKRNLKEKFHARNSVELISKVQHFLLRENDKK